MSDDNELSILEHQLRKSLKTEGPREHLNNALQACEGIRQLAREIPDPSQVAALVLYVASIENRIGKALAQLENIAEKQ